jgi:hypothetical protein
MATRQPRSVLLSLPSTYGGQSGKIRIMAFNTTEGYSLSFISPFKVNEWRSLLLIRI